MVGSHNEHMMSLRQFENLGAEQWAGCKIKGRFVLKCDRFLQFPLGFR